MLPPGMAMAVPSMGMGMGVGVGGTMGMGMGMGMGGPATMMGAPPGTDEAGWQRGR
jgi:hypothetical protein